MEIEYFIKRLKSYQVTIKLTYSQGQTGQISKRGEGASGKLLFVQYDENLRSKVHSF